MMEECFENLICTGQIDGKRVEAIKDITYNEHDQIDDGKGLMEKNRKFKS